MSTSSTKNPPTVLLVGGGIGGMAAALALARLGMTIDLLEQSAAIGEIGAGLQLGPTPSPRSTRWAWARRCGAARSSPTGW